MKVRNNKGSVAVFVLVGLFFMSSFLLITYANNMNKSKVAKEQLNMISSTYSYGDGDAASYARAYDDLRSKNKQILTASVTGTSTLELSKTFEDRVINYTIYGNSTAVGIYDSSTGKYKIQIKVTDSSGNSKTSDIYLAAPLGRSGSYTDYIDYRSQTIVRRTSTSQTTEKIALPVINSYDDYTKIEILGNVPSKIEIEYVGYTL